MTTEFLRDADGHQLRHADGATMLAAAGCCYYQARTCPRPGELVDVWIRATELPQKPFYFEKNAAPGTYYQIPSDAVASLCPGTIVTPIEATEEDCDGPPPICTRCSPCCFSDQSIVTRPVMTLPTSTGNALQNAKHAAFNAMTREMRTGPGGCAWDSVSDEFTVSGETYRIKQQYWFSGGTEAGQQVPVYFAAWAEHKTGGVFGNDYDYRIATVRMESGGAVVNCCMRTFSSWREGTYDTEHIGELVFITSNNKCCAHVLPSFWSPATTYSIGDTCRGGGDGDTFFRSTQNDNLNHTPNLGISYWWEIYGPCDVTDDDNCPGDESCEDLENPFP